MALALPVLIAAALLHAQTSALDTWISEDAAQLAPYAFQLYPEIDASKDTAALDKLLADVIGRDRLVVRMSRSEYYRSYYPNATWAKVHLVTSKPGEARTQIQIKLLAKLKQQGGEWKVAEVKDLAIP